MYLLLIFQEKSLRGAGAIGGLQEGTARKGAASIGDGKIRVGSANAKQPPKLYLNITLFFF